MITVLHFFLPNEDKDAIEIDTTVIPNLNEKIFIQDIAYTVIDKDFSLNEDNTMYCSLTLTVEEDN